MRTKFFLIKESKDCDTVNAFLNTLEQNEVDYTYEHIQEGIGILITIRYERRVLKHANS